MKKILFGLVSLGAVLAIAGCSTSSASKPSNVTLVQALHDVGAGLASFKAAELEMVATNAYLRETYGTNGDFITGLMPTELDVTFNVTESASNKNELALDLHTPPAASVGGKLGDTLSTQSAASRGNQITLKFNSIFFSSTTITTTSTNGTKVSVDGKLTDPAQLAAFCKIIGLTGETETNQPPVK